jgi:small subunit ribosomal protein S18
MNKKIEVKPNPTLKNIIFKDIDYKNVSLLKKFLNSRFKILPSSATGISAKKQRKLKFEIKKARIMGLLPFTDRHAL